MSNTTRTSVVIQSQNFGSIRAHSAQFFTADWNTPRRISNTWYTNLVGEAAAEEAFIITNAPDEVLSKEQLAIRASLRPAHSVSVGDVVTVGGKDYLCAGSGWETR